MHFPSPRLSLIALLSILLLTACGPSTVSQLTKETGAKQLTAGELLLAAKGNTLFIHGQKVNSYFYFDASGYVFGLDIYSHKDSGRWDVSDKGELCFKMDDWWLGKLRCFPVYRDDSKYYLFNTSNVLEYTADHFEGDKKNLYDDKKLARKSFFKTQNSEQKADVPKSAPETDNTSPIADDTVSSRAVSDEELQSTVKWMAKDCPGCNLAGADLAGAELIGAKLQGADLSGANLSRANLRRADLKEANLKNGDLSYANLPGADLRESDLTNADFTGANLIRANFTGADTAGANFEGALLEGVEGLQQQ